LPPGSGSFSFLCQGAVFLCAQLWSVRDFSAQKFLAVVQVLGGGFFEPFFCPRASAPRSWVPLVSLHFSGCFSFPCGDFWFSLPAACARFSSQSESASVSLLLFYRWRPRRQGPRGSGSPSSTPAPGKGKEVSTRVVHDDDEVSSDEDETLQVQLRSQFPAGGSSSRTASPVAAAAEAVGAEGPSDRRTAEEAAATEVAGEGPPVPGQAPSSAAGAKRAATPSGSSPPAKRPYRGVWRPRYVPKSLRPVSFSFCEAHYFSFPSSRPPLAPRAPSVATVASPAAPAAGATGPAVAVEVVPELVAGGTPQTPEGVPVDVPESPADAPEAVPSPSPMEVLAEEVTPVVRTAVPSSPLAAAAAFPSALGTAVAADAGADAAGETKVVMGHPTYHAPGDVSLDGAVSTALRALSQVQRVLHREDGDLADERHRLQLWASMLKETTATERAGASAWL
jgi:hypothetical protein